MRRSLPQALLFGGVLAGAVVLVLWLRGRERATTPGPSAAAPAAEVRDGDSFPAAFAPGEPPRLLPARAGTAERPVLSWERLLAADGSPAEDLPALADLTTGYLQAGLGEARREIGFNEDLAAALGDATALGEAALPADHPALRDGRLIDRWGTPWQVHPLARDLIQLRSAGPDRRLYTADDLVTPKDGSAD